MNTVRLRLRAKLALSMTCVALCACASHPAALDGDRVAVEFEGPERFTDFGPRYASEAQRDAQVAVLRTHLVNRGSQLLSDRQGLRVTITDVDMAGWAESRALNFYGRSVRDVQPTRIDLRFVLTAPDGSLLRGGERRLSDPYLLPPPTDYRGDPLRHEKALLDRWLERELVGAGQVDRAAPR